jgi:S-DNA-T family DNA segregation ATPase FtsK/SpoIIIE
MDKLIKKIPEDVMSKIAGKMVIEAGVATGPSFMVFMEEKFDPPANIIESSEWKDSTAEIPIVLGMDASGKLIVADLAKLPHLLIAGSTGSGKSVLINSLIISMLGKFAPSELRLMLFDPTYVEFSHYASLPHLILPVINSPAELPVALNWIIDEMERRQKTEEKLPRIVIILDELADVMMSDARERVESCIGKIAQTGSSCGIHMVISTQTPRKQIITLAIKANIVSCIAFRVSSESDSNVILGRKGAETLLGSGDMLFMDSSGAAPVRIQGAMVSEGEVERVVKVISSQTKGKLIHIP